MDWWNNFLDWAHSDNGWRILSGAIVPFVAIIVAGVVAALIGRGATKRVITLQERESKNAAVGGVISAARKAATWGSLGHDERSYADHLAVDADIRLRLLPIAGAAVAADWAQHEIADIKKNSSTFSFQAEQSLAEFRDRMLEWQARPARARKLFRSDLERWKFETPDGDADLVQRQQQWNADQVAPTSPPTAGTTPTTTALRPAPAATPTGSGSTAAGSAAPAATPSASESPSSAPTGTSTAPGGFGSDASRPVEASAHANAADRTSDVTTPLGGAPYGSRPTPASSTSTGAPAGASSVTPAGAGASTASTSSARPSSPSAAPFESHSEERAPERAASTDHEDAFDDEPTTLAEPTAEATSGAGRNTTSVLARVTDAPAEAAESDETKEAAYASPLSASELRRRAEEDDE
jgi:hypothetical protein